MAHARMKNCQGARHGIGGEINDGLDGRTSWRGCDRPGGDIAKPGMSQGALSLRG